MQTQLLKIEDLMVRWQVNRQTINNYMNEGIISRIEGFKCVRFNPRQIEALEGKLDERKTWKEIELEEENNILRNEIERLNGIIGQVIGNLSSAYMKSNKRIG